MARVDNAAGTSAASDLAGASTANVVATVQVGETDLSQVAQRLGLDLASLLEANPNLANGAKLQAGQDVCLQGVKSSQVPVEEIAMSHEAQGEGLPSGPSTLAANETMAKTMVQFRLDGRSQQPGFPGMMPPVLRWGPGPNVTGAGSATKTTTAAQANQLEDAARTGDLKKLEALIKSGVDVNAKGSDGQTALMAAAAMGNTDAMKMLIDAGADVNATGPNGQTALMKAIHTGQDDSVDCLLKNHADVNLADNDKNTALMLAINDGRQGAITALMNEKPKLDLQQKDGKTALMLAVEKGDRNTVDVLLQAGANADIQDNSKKTALMGLLQNAHDQGQKPDLAIAKALIAKSSVATLNQKGSDGKTVMMQAASLGNKSVVMALIDAKADPDITDKDGRTAIMELLGRSSSGASNLPADQTLTSSEAKALIAASKKIDQADNNGRTALMEAASNGHNATVVALIDSKKVDVNKKDKYGNTALITFANHPSDTVGDPAFDAAAKALIDATGKKNLDYSLKDGTTALIAAARSGNRDLVKALNVAGANLNAQDNKGRTALMFAAKAGDKWTVRFLLDKDWAGEGKSGLHKANPSITDKSGQTAKDIATQQLQNSQSLGLSDFDKQKLQEVIDMLP